MDLDQEVQTCPECGMRFGAPKHWWNSRREDKRTFYCPNGHQQSYRTSASEQLRQERDRLKQQMAQKDDEISEMRKGWNEAEERAAQEARRVVAAKGQITKLKKRAQNGVCPCCNRTFSDLQRHMASKHPTFEKDANDADNIVPLKRA